MTNLKILRKPTTPHSTSGSLYFEDVFECYTLEDVDRGLHKDMQLHISQSMKIQNETAIPYGTYEIVIDASARFKRLMPHILGVPAFDGIRIHWGNSDLDTDGCPILGQVPGIDFVGHSVIAFNAFFPKLRSALDHGQCFITIAKEEVVV